MDLWTGISIVVRRWYVALPLLAASLVVAAVAGAEVQRQYRAGASVVLVAPQAKIVANVRQPLDNPFDTRSLGAAVHRQLSDSDLALALEEEGFATDYTLNFDRDASIIDLTVTASDAERAVATVQRLITEARAGLDRSQAAAEVAPDSAISLDTVTATERAEPLRGGRFRVVVTIVLLGAVIATSAALATESFVLHRRNLGLAHPGDAALGPLPSTRTDRRPPTDDDAGSRPTAGAARRAMPPPVPTSTGGRSAADPLDPTMIDLRARLSAFRPDGEPRRLAMGALDPADDGPAPAPHER